MPRLYHRHLWIDRELEAPVSRAQRVFDVARPDRAGEYEAEVAGALWQRHEDLVCPGGDPHILHAGHATSDVQALDAPKHPSARNGNHRHAGRGRLALPVLGRLAKRVTQEEFLEGDQRPTSP